MSGEGLVTSAVYAGVCVRGACRVEEDRDYEDQELVMNSMLCCTVHKTSAF